MMETEKYEIVIDELGTYERISENIFGALDLLKSDLKPVTPFKIISAYIIKCNQPKVDITDILNGTCYAANQVKP